MRKDRNTFFAESNMYQNNYNPMMNQNSMAPNGPMINPAPYQASQASQSFYAGPQPNQMMAPSFGTEPTNTSNYESRLAKLERQIRRIETRINKLEGNLGTFSSVEEIDASISSSMYMV